MATYESYKDSGVKWLGQIPSHWEVKKLRAFFSEVCESNSALKVHNQLQFKYGTIVPKPNTGVDDAVLKTVSKYTVVNRGDIIINGLNLNYDFISFRVGKVNEQGVITSAYIAMRPNKGLSSKFYEYLLKAMDAKKVFHGFGTGIRATLSFKELKHKFLPLVPLNEQEAIVAYLDKVTGDIDRAIEAQQKMIDALNERKQIIITRAVTRGLNPDAPLRDSCIDWLGQIPEHWEIIPMRYLCKMKTGDKDTIMRDDNGKYPFYVRSPHIEHINTYSYDGEAVLMAGDGVGAGKVFHYVNGKFDYHQRVYNFHQFKRITGEFLYFYLKCNFRYKIEEGGAKSTVDSVRLPWLKAFPICVMPKDEQQSIVEHIHKSTGPIDCALSNCERMISLLQERKQIIINEVVTGKTKVI